MRDPVNEVTFLRALKKEQIFQLKVTHLPYFNDFKTNKITHEFILIKLSIVSLQRGSSSSWFPIFALNPDAIHFKLTPAIHLQSAIDVVLFFNKPSLLEHLGKVL